MQQKRQAEVIAAIAAFCGVNNKRVVATAFILFLVADEYTRTYTHTYKQTAGHQLFLYFKVSHLQFDKDAPPHQH